MFSSLSTMRINGLGCIVIQNSTGSKARFLDSGDLDRSPFINRQPRRDTNSDEIGAQNVFKLKHQHIQNLPNHSPPKLFILSNNQPSQRLYPELSNSR